MNTVHYDIRDFKWNAESNTFYGDGFDLYDAEGTYSRPFPNSRRQFVIKNYKTGNFRRFRFQEKMVDLFGSFYIFTSEDGFKCHINLD